MTKSKLEWETKHYTAYSEDSNTNYTIEPNDDKFVLQVDDNWAGIYTTEAKAKKVAELIEEG